jgi:hypothetical protein
MAEETGYSRTPGPPNPGRRLIAVLAGVLLVGDVVAALLLGPRLVAWADLDGALLSALRWPSDSSTVPETRPAPPVDDSLTQAAPEPQLSDDAVVSAEVQALLDARAIALLARDRAGFLAALDPASPQFVEQQGAVFDALAEVPLGTWTYQVAGDAPDLPPERAAALGAEARLVRVLQHHRFAELDPSDLSTELFLTVVRRGDTWRIAGDTDGEAVGVRSGRDVWDFGPVSVVQGESSIVLGLGDVEVLERHAKEADRAVSAVSEVWGTSWSQRIVVIAPSDTGQLAAILGGSDGDYDQIAAVTTGHFLTGHTATSADRVLLNPDAFAELSAIGRRVVLTHETTHVAARAASTGSLPAWLAEGFADYVGFRNSDVPVRVAAQDVLRQVRADGPPAGLPADDAFEPTSESLASAYESSWLACRLIAQTYGEEQLVAFYQAVAAAGTEPAVATESAFQTVLGTTSAEFVATWQAAVQELAS